MADPDITDILADLSAGRIDAAEAGRRIDARKSPRRSAPEPDPEPTQESPASERQGNKGVSKVSVVAVGRRVRLVGDSSVATASVEGPHVLRRSGATLEISSTGEVGPSFDGFSLIRPPRSLEDLRNIGLGKELIVRINPAIAVDVEVTTGGLNSVGVPTFGRVRVTAAGAELSDVTEVADMLVQAGGGTIVGPICHGRSRVRVESGTLTVKLAPGSNVTVRGESHLGRISWPGESASPVDELVIGNGSARLDVGVVMGMASIKEEQ